jgi:ankyrin repeat protein
MMALMPYTDEPGVTPQERRRRRLDKLDAAGLFLTRCFEVGRADEHGMTALHVAVTAPDPERIVTRLITRMLECGVTPDPKNAEGVTPLMLAVQAKRKALAKFLVEAGADLNAQSKAGDTPLTLAENSKDRELVKTLRKAVPTDAGL